MRSKALRYNGIRAPAAPPAARVPPRRPAPGTHTRGAGSMTGGAPLPPGDLSFSGTGGCDSPPPRCLSPRCRHGRDGAYGRAARGSGSARETEPVPDRVTVSCRWGRRCRGLAAARARSWCRGPRRRRGWGLSSRGQARRPRALRRAGRSRGSAAGPWSRGWPRGERSAPGLEAVAQHFLRFARSSAAPADSWAASVPVPAGTRAIAMPR